MQKGTARIVGVLNSKGEWATLQETRVMELAPPHSTTGVNPGSPKPPRVWLPRSSASSLAPRRRRPRKAPSAARSPSSLATGSLLGMHRVSSTAGHSCSGLAVCGTLFTRCMPLCFSVCCPQAKDLQTPVWADGEAPDWHLTMHETVCLDVPNLRGGAVSLLLQGVQPLQRSFGQAY